MKRAIATFHGPGSLTVTEGSLYEDKDPLVKSYPTMFEDTDAAALRLMEQPPVFRAVEQATAAPGEKRTVVRSKD